MHVVSLFLYKYGERDSKDILIQKRHMQRYSHTLNLFYSTAISAVLAMLSYTITEDNTYITYCVIFIKYYIY